MGSVADTRVPLTVMDTTPLARRRDLARTVRDVLRTAILHGDFENGELPTEDELRVDFNVSRNVVREALSLLRDEDLIERVQGAGTFAVARRVTQRAELMESFAESIGNGEERVTYRMLRSELVAGPSMITRRLGLPPRAMTILVERLTSVDGEPLQLTTRYVPADRVLPLMAARMSTTPWYRLGILQDELGLSLSESVISVEAVPADPSVTELLDCPVGHGLLLIERLLVADDGTPFEFSASRYPGDRYALMSVLGNVRSTHGPRPEQRHPGDSSSVVDISAGRTGSRRAAGWLNS